MQYVYAKHRSKVEVTLRLTVGQSVCLGIEHPCGTCDQILLPVGMLQSEIWGFVSVERPLWREDGSAICSVITPSTWRARLPYLYPPGTGLLSKTPGLKSKSKLLYDWWSVSQYVLVSSTLVGLVTRYYFLSECCCLKFGVLFLWNALSDERMGLQFAA
jgi:hypothetical protein